MSNDKSWLAQGRIDGVIRSKEFATSDEACAWALANCQSMMTVGNYESGDNGQYLDEWALEWRDDDQFWVKHIPAYLEGEARPRVIWQPYVPTVEGLLVDAGQQSITPEEPTDHGPFPED